MGPVANRPQYDRIRDMIRLAVDEGAQCLAGGADGAGGAGLFVQPTVLGNVAAGAAIAQREVFGPVLCVLPFRTEEEAVAIANGTEYGLASGVWTQDLSRAVRVSSALRSGVTWVNTYRTNAVQAPFGGVGGSGYGRERGEDGIREFTYTKNVMVDIGAGARGPFALQT